MKKLFYTGVAGLILFEILNVYFIMPMPGSQQMPSIGVAYWLYSWRWVFRGVSGMLILAGLFSAVKDSRWLAVSALVLAAVVGYAFNFRMAADHLFYQPRTLVMQGSGQNVIAPDKLVIGVEINGQAKAYPIQLIGYHHQVSDTVGSKPVLVTYCTVCRTGRVFEPVVSGKPEQFRLVGMDHFNAMFEDASTKSWWRQATGEAITGELTGQTLPEVFSRQTSLAQWLALYPNSLIMQPDSAFATAYEHMKTYDQGKGSSDLTRTDSLSWKEKSWVVGIAVGKASKAFDWNRLVKERVINQQIGSHPVVLALAADSLSFFAFMRPNQETIFTLQNDTLQAGNRHYTLSGKAAGNQLPEAPLRQLKAYQEFWHSWQTFHPDTEKY